LDTYYQTFGIGLQGQLLLHLFIFYTLSLSLFCVYLTCVVYDLPSVNLKDDDKIVGMRTKDNTLKISFSYRIKESKNIFTTRNKEVM